MGASDAIKNSLLDKLFNDVDFTQGDTYISLHTSDPQSGSTDEVSGGSYARQQVDENGGTSPAWTTASSGVVDNDADVDFADMPAVTVTHVGIFDAASGGTLIWAGALDSSVTTNSGDTFRFQTGDLNVQLTG